MKWVKNAPKVWERLERMKTVGPKMNTPTTSTMLRIELASLIRFMPLFTPRKAETAVSPPSTTITRNQTVGPEVMPVKEVSPELNCMAAKPKDVASPRTVAMIASSSMITPAGRCAAAGSMSTVASRKVRVLPRL